MRGTLQWSRTAVMVGMETPLISDLDPLSLAAIGVTEGISVILRQAEQIPDFGDRLVLFAIGILLFGIPLQAGFVLMSLFQRRFGRSTVEEEASA